MKRFGSRAAIAILVASFAWESHAIEAEWDLRLKGTWTPTSAVGCGTSLSPFGTGNLVSGIGFGILGGSSDLLIDGGEQVQVTLPSVGVTGVAYVVSAASNVDADAFVGEGFVEAFDTSLTSLGVEPVSGTGTRDVSTLFGGVAIQRFLLTAAQDGVRLRSISYDVPVGLEVVGSLFPAAFSPSEVVVQGLQYSSCGFTARSPSGSIRLQGGSIQGIAVAGGDDEWIDGGEEIEIEFDEPVGGVSYELNDAVEVSGGGLGGHFVEAFDALGESLGLRAAVGLDPIELSTVEYYGDEPISRFVLIATGDQLRLGPVAYTALPEPVNGAVGALAALALRARVRRSRLASASSTRG